MKSFLITGREKKITFNKIYIIQDFIFNLLYEKRFILIVAASCININTDYSIYNI